LRVLVPRNDITLPKAATRGLEGSRKQNEPVEARFNVKVDVFRLGSTGTGIELAVESSLFGRAETRVYVAATLSRSSSSCARCWMFKTSADWEQRLILRRRSGTTKSSRPWGEVMRIGRS